MYNFTEDSPYLAPIQKRHEILVIIFSCIGVGLFLQVICVGRFLFYSFKKQKMYNESLSRKECMEVCLFRRVHLLRGSTRMEEIRERRGIELIYNDWSSSSMLREEKGIPTMWMWHVNKWGDNIVFPDLAGPLDLGSVSV